MPARGGAANAPARSAAPACRGVRTAGARTVALSRRARRSPLIATWLDLPPRGSRFRDGLRRGKLRVGAGCIAYRWVRIRYTKYSPLPIGQVALNEGA